MTPTKDAGKILDGHGEACEKIVDDDSNSNSHAGGTPK